MTRSTLNLVGKWKWSECLKDCDRSVRDAYEADPDRFWLRLAYQVAAKDSDDPATQNGAVIAPADGGIPVFGANKFPPNVAKWSERLERPAKYQWIEHAERFAILNANIDLTGATMYCPWAACCDCARVIIISGIKELVGHQEIHDKTPERWRESIATANQMLDETGVKRRMVSGKIGGVRVLFDGKYWEP